MKKITTLISFVMFVFLCGSVWGATYYVTQTGSGTRDGLTYANSKSVSAHNSSTFASDDIVYLCDTITSQVIVPSSGTSGHPIVYRGDYPGHPGVLDALRTGTGFSATKKSYIVLKNITAKNGKYYCISNWVGSNYNQYINLTVYGSAYHGLQIRGSSYITVTGGTFHDNGKNGIQIESVHTDSPATVAHVIIDGVTAYNNHNKGIAVMTDTNIYTGPSYMGNVSNIEIKNSTFYGNGDGVYCIKANGCYIHNNISHSNTYVGSAGGEGYGIAVEGGNNTIIDSNLVYGNLSQGIEIWSNSIITANDCKIRRNRVYGHPNQNGIRANKNTQTNMEVSQNIVSGNYYGINFGGSSLGNVIYNNTAHDNAINYFLNDGADSGKYTIFRNNISAFPTLYGFAAGATPSAYFTHDHNLYYKTSGYAIRWGITNPVYYTLDRTRIWEATAVVTDPLFQSTTDFRPHPDSPAINAGVNVGLTTDYSGLPINGLPDIGAYEYQPISTSTPTPTPKVSTIPIAPSGLSAVIVYSGKVNLTWTDNASNETGFRIERCAGSSTCTSFSLIATVAANVTSYSDTGLSTNTTYRYRVRAYNVAGDSAYSNTVTTAPTSTPTVSTIPIAPSGLSAVIVSSGKVNLTWTDNASNETGFRIERCAGATCTNFSGVNSTRANVTSYYNTDVSKNTTYRYRVRAYNTAGISAYSNIATAKTP